jgi:hypothetical protein
MRSIRTLRFSPHGQKRHFLQRPTAIEQTSFDLGLTFSLAAAVSQ